MNGFSLDAPPELKKRRTEAVKTGHGQVALRPLSGGDGESAGKQIYVAPEQEGAFEKAYAKTVIELRESRQQRKEVRVLPEAEKDEWELCWVEKYRGGRSTTLQGMSGVEAVEMVATDPNMAAWLVQVGLKKSKKHRVRTYGSLTCAKM